MIQIKKVFKWSLISIVILISFTCLVVVGTIRLVNSSYGKNFLIGRINTVIAGELTASRIQLSPLNGILELKEVALKDPHGMPVTGFERLYIRLAWSYIFQKQLHISDIRLENPWGRFYMTDDGGFNLMEAVAVSSQKEEPEPEPSGHKGLPFNIVVEYLSILNGDISFDYPEKFIAAKLTGADIWADGNFLAQQANVKVSLADLMFKSSKIQLPSTHLNLSAALDRSRVEIIDFGLGVGASSLDISGFVDDIYELSGTKVAVQSKLNMDEIKEIFQLPKTWQGDIKLNAGLAGQVKNPDVNLKLELEDGTIFNHRFDQVNLFATLTDRKLKLENVHAQLGQGKVDLSGFVDLKTAFANGFLKPPVNLDAISFDLALNQNTPDLEPWVPEVENLKGALESRLTLSGKGTSLQALSAKLNLDVKGSQLSAPGVRRPLKGAFNIDLTLDNQSFKLQQLSGVIDGIKMDGAGSYEPDERIATAQLVLDAQDLSQPLTLFGLPDARGTVNLSLDLSGTLLKPTLGVVLKSKDLAYGDVAIGTVSLAADLSPNRVLQISSLKLDNQGSQLNGRAQIRFLEGWKGIDPKYDQTLELDLKGIEVKDFYHQEIIRGGLDGRIVLGGFLEKLKGDVALNAYGLATETIRLGNFDTKIRLDGNMVYLEQLLLKNNESELMGSGKILLLDDAFGKLQQDPKFDLKLISSKLDLKDFLNDFGGVFSLQTDLSGSIKQPYGTLTLAGQNLQTGAQDISTLKLSARVDGDRVRIAPLDVTLSDQENLILNGWAKLDRSFSFDLKSSGIKLASIDAMKDFSAFKGCFKTYISGQGTIDDPDIDGSLLLEDIQINDEPIQDFRFHLSLHDHLARVYGDLGYDLDARYHLLNKDFMAKLDFYQTQLNPYLRIAKQPDLNGEVSGQINVEGNVDRPNDIVAHLNLEDLSLFLKDIRLLETKRFKARMIDRHIQIEDAQVDLLSQGKFSMAGTALLNGPVDLTADLELPIIDAASFSDVLADAKGNVAVAARVTGSLPKPQIYLDVALAQIGLTVPETGQNIENVNGTINIDPKQMSIKDISGQLDTGKFNLTGRIEHDFFKPTNVDINLIGDALPIEIPDMLSLLINSRIQIVGEKGEAEAKGEIVLSSGTYYRDVNINLLLLESIGKRGRSVAPPSKPIVLPFFKKIALNIDVSHREPFLVENNLAEMEIRPDLSIGGTLNQPVVKGRADVTSGTIIFKKKEFEIQKGIIDFVNPYKTEMYLDIESETILEEDTDDERTITLTLKGTPNDLQLNLSSSPDELSDADILSLLIFGKTSTELANGEDKNNTSTEELLAGILADTLGGELKDATGMDILELETSTDTDDTSEDNTESEHVKVTVGKHLSDRMTVKVDLESKDGEMIQRAISEYKFLEHILLSGFQDTQGGFGGELVFRIEFR